MRKINKKDIVKALLVLTLVAGIGMAYGSIGRFEPTHMIVQPVFCGSCHPEEVSELSQTTHLGKFAHQINGYIADSQVNGVASTQSTNARAISGACTLCHNYWDNMEWYGVSNFTLSPYDNITDNATMASAMTDIYGNSVSPYGLGSTTEWLMSFDYNTSTCVNSAALGYNTCIVKLSSMPWNQGLDTYQYTDSNNVTHYRLDYIWSALSAVSPGPVAFQMRDNVTGYYTSCGTGNAEHAMCHLGASAVAESFADDKTTVQNFTVSTKSGPKTYSGNGIFFSHEMAFTTAQYAAKPVKICGACHVLKLPPMQWGGEPWSESDIQYAQNSSYTNASLGPNDDPFGFRPTYNSLIKVVGGNLTYEDDKQPPLFDSRPVMFKTADWAHANVPCIRCHEHAGINGNTVTSTSGSNMTDPATGNQVSTE